MIRSSCVGTYRPDWPWGRGGAMCVAMRWSIGPFGVKDLFTLRSVHRHRNSRAASGRVKHAFLARISPPRAPEQSSGALGVAHAVLAIAGQTVGGRAHEARHAF